MIERARVRGREGLKPAGQSFQLTPTLSLPQLLSNKSFILFSTDRLYDLRLFHVHLAERAVRDLRGQPGAGHVRRQLLLLSPHLGLAPPAG